MVNSLDEFFNVQTAVAEQQIKLQGGGFNFATVTQISPTVKVRIDGDIITADVTPISLIPVNTDDRVMVLYYQRQLIVVGVVGGAATIICTSGARPAHKVGRTIFETDTGRTGVSDGTYWTLTRPDAYCQVWQTAGQTITPYTWTALTWSGTEHDGITAWHGATTGITVPWAGLYKVYGTFCVGNGDYHGLNATAELRINSVAMYGAVVNFNHPVGYTNETFFSLPTRRSTFAANDVFGMGCYVACGGHAAPAHVTIVDGSRRSMLGIEYLYTKEA